MIFPFPLSLVLLEIGERDRTRCVIGGIPIPSPKVGLQGDRLLVALDHLEEAIRVDQHEVASKIQIAVL